MDKNIQSEILQEMITNKNGFTNELLEGHLNLGFGSMTKKDIDLLVLKYIVNTHVANNNGELNYFELSKQLRITVTKLKGLVKEMQARYFYNLYDSGEFNKRLANIIKKSKYKIEGEKIKFAPIDPMFTQYMQMYAYKLNTFFDGSFNPDLIVINIEDFLNIISLTLKIGNGYIDVLNEIKKYQNNDTIKILEDEIANVEKTDKRIDWYRIAEIAINTIPSLIKPLIN